jgi:hypothetical protein
MTTPEMAKALFKKLSPKKEAEFRAWARKNHHPGDKIDPLWHPIVKDECEKIDLEALQTHYVNLYRKVFNTNLGLWSKEISQFSRKQLEDAITAFDMLSKLNETSQTWIVGHDMPLSISHDLFKMLDIRRRSVAVLKRVPEEQYEFEDIIAHLLGLSE